MALVGDILYSKNSSINNPTFFDSAGSAVTFGVVGTLNTSLDAKWKVESVDGSGNPTKLLPYSSISTADSTAANQVVGNNNIGNTITAVATDGDLSTLTTGQNRFTVDPLANTAGVSNNRYSLNTLFRWITRLSQDLFTDVNAGFGAAGFRLGTFIFASRIAPTAVTAGSITVGGVSQQMFASRANRRYMFIQNTSAITLYLNFGSTAATSTGSSIALAAGATFELGSSVIITSAVTVLGATIGATFVYLEV